MDSLEAWTLTKKNCELFALFERKILRKMVRPYMRMDDSVTYIIRKFTSDTTTDCFWIKSCTTGSVGRGTKSVRVRMIQPAKSMRALTKVKHEDEADPASDETMA